MSSYPTLILARAADSAGIVAARHGLRREQWILVTDPWQMLGRSGEHPSLYAHDVDHRLVDMDTRRKARRLP